VSDLAPRPVRIRPERVGDAAGIRLVHDAAFPGPMEGRLVGGGAAFQVLELRAGALPRGARLVRYAPEFTALGGAAGGPAAPQPL
jgi:hypothetical protein